MNETLLPNEDELILFHFERISSAQYGFSRTDVSEEQLAKLKQNSQAAMNLAMGTLRATAHRVGRTLQALEHDLTPNEVEVEFAISLEVNGKGETPDLVNAFIVKAEAGGSVSGQFKVKFKWNIEKPKQTQVLVSEG